MGTSRLRVLDAHTQRRGPQNGGARPWPQLISRPGLDRWHQRFRRGSHHGPPRTAATAMSGISVDSAELFRAEITTRIPFKYGIVTMVNVPHVFVRLTVRTEAGSHAGIAADHLPPKWFVKDPARAIADEIDDMMCVITHAATAARALSAPTVFQFWHELHETQAQWAEAKGFPPLLAHFGTSLVERALIDAFARVHRTTFAHLLRGDALGLRLGDIHPELAAARPTDLLPKEPAVRVRCRHTIGLADPLREAEVAAQQMPGDSLPYSLEANIRQYGLRHFKIKIDGGSPDATIDRLNTVAAVLSEQVSGDLAVSLDGNESFGSAEAFREFWSHATGHAPIGWLFRHLLFVEQPLSRSVALDASRAAFNVWAERPPIIIDESDAEPSDLRHALELGYAGTSHKNCKGIFKGLAHACLIAQRKRQQAGATLIMSGEDLCNIGPVALLQDLAVQALLGVASVERNGHHYFAGLSMWPEEIQRAVLLQHPDLYTMSEQGWPRLVVKDGWLSTRSVVAAPFGVGPELRLEALPCEHTML
ncbi:MAG: hypothetical protein GEU99_23180 [Luteitalea sp.]|nr:hypothetical protein [Luteitalea sp.]